MSSDLYPTRVFFEGERGIVKAPGVLVALSPFYAFDFLIHQDFHVSFAILGAAFLAVTGGEAMYADMGHFGAGPIRLTWYGLVLPTLLLSGFRKPVFGPLLGRDVAPEDGEGHCETSRFLVSMVLSHCRQFVAGVSWQRADRAAWPPARDEARRPQ